MPTTSGRVQVLEFNLTVVEGEDLAAKDRNMFGIRTTSDPCAIVRFWPKGRNRGDPIFVGKCDPVMKDLNPKWNFVCQSLSVPVSETTKDAQFEIRLMDYDALSADDDMGKAFVPTSGNSSQWHSVKAPDGSKAGQIQCDLAMKKRLGHPETQLKPPLPAHIAGVASANKGMGNHHRGTAGTGRMLDRNHSRRRRVHG